MKKSESVTDFYKRQPGHLTDGMTLNNAGLGHINIFSRENCSVVTPYSRRDFYKVSLIIGTGKLYYADRWIQIDKPALLFSNPVVPYSWEAESEAQSGWYCLFTEDFIQHSERINSLLESPLFKLGSNPVFFPDEAQVSEIASIFAKMRIEIASEYVHKYDILRSYLHLLIHEAMKASPAEEFGSYTNGATRVSSLFIELLERQFPIDSPTISLNLKSPVDYAKALSVHVNHLNRSVKEVTGKTTTEHIAARVVKEAKALLQYTDWNVSEIAYSLGFEYPSYFSIFFKKQTGMPPNQLRNAVV